MDLKKIDARERGTRSQKLNFVKELYAMPYRGIEKRKQNSLLLKRAKKSIALYFF